MNLRFAFLLGMSAAVMLGVASGSAAGIDLSVQVEGEPVEDGDTVELDAAETDFSNVEVFVSASSDSTLTQIMIEHDGARQYAGVDKESYSSTRTLQVAFGKSTLTVSASDAGGAEESVSVTLDRPATTEAELRSMIEQKENELQEINESIGELQQQEETLEEENERLREENQELRERVEEGAQGLPGFTFLAAVSAFLAFAAARRL